MLKLSIVVFQRCHQGEKFAIRGFNFESQRFLCCNNFSRSLKTVLSSSLKSPSSKYHDFFSTPNCQSDPKWNSKIKLETQDLLAVSNTRFDYLITVKQETWLPVRRVPSGVLICLRVYFKKFLQPNLSFYRIESVFKVTFHDYVLLRSFSFGAFFQNRNIWGQFNAPFGACAYLSTSIFCLA